MVTYLVVYCFNKMLLVHQVDQLISEFCNVAQQVCTAMRTWCREDRLYPKRLWEEIIRTTNRRGKLLEQQKRAERKHRDITQQLDRKRVCQCELDKEVFQTSCWIIFLNIHLNLIALTKGAWDVFLSPCPLDEGRGIMSVQCNNFVLP